MRKFYAIENHRQRRLFEEILAFHQAAENAGLGKSDLEDVFYNNSSGSIEAVRKGK